MWFIIGICISVLSHDSSHIWYLSCYWDSFQSFTTATNNNIKQWCRWAGYTVVVKVKGISNQRKREREREKLSFLFMSFEPYVFEKKWAFFWVLVLVLSAGDTDSHGRKRKERLLLSGGECCTTLQWCVWKLLLGKKCFLLNLTMQIGFHFSLSTLLPRA